MSQKKPAAGGEEVSRFTAALSCLREIHSNLVEENRLLREDPARSLPDDPQTTRDLERKVASLERQNNELVARLGSASGSRREGPQQDLLVNLYVAGYHLHRSRDLQDVLTSVKEILLNLVGAETFAVYLLDGNGTTLTQVADENSRPPATRRIPLSEGIMGVVAKTGIAYFDGERQHGDFHNPVACVPLKAEEQLLGVLQIHRLFTQKKTLTPQDHEIFTLLAETAGTAMLSAILRRRYLRSAAEKPSPWGDLLQSMELIGHEEAGMAATPMEDELGTEGGRA